MAREPHQPGPELPELPERLPPELTRNLADVHDARLFVPASVDDNVLAAARAHFASRRERQPSRRWLVGSITGAAAAAAIAAGVWVYQGYSPSPPGGAMARDVYDRDGNGRVDILDALVLARQLEAGAPAIAGDVNDDGATDRRDIDAIAMRAVSLALEPRS